MKMALVFLVLLGCGVSERPPTIAIEPSEVPLIVGESFQFHAVVTNGDGYRVVWSVVEPDGGSITQDGVYTAPYACGTYHVNASLE